MRDALKQLFSEPRLPDNPYFYLANVLNAYVDQSQLWKCPAGDITAAYDLEVREGGERGGGSHGRAGGGGAAGESGRRGCGGWGVGGEVAGGHG